jgi:hypothetical protein
LSLLVLIGFTRTFYARALFELPPLPTTLQLHGAVFTAWFLLFVVQARLIATHRMRAHMTLGIVGALLAVLVVTIGAGTTSCTRYTPSAARCWFSRGRCV